MKEQIPVIVLAAGKGTKEWLKTADKKMREKQDHVVQK
jgi:hypothetical protein